MLITVVIKRHRTFKNVKLGYGYCQFYQFINNK